MKKNILIYYCGGEVGLEIYESLKNSVHFNVYGANSKKSIADLIFENEVISLPNIYDDNFINQLNIVIEKFNIDLIFPTHDELVYFFSKNETKIKTRLVGCNPETVEITKDKSKTYQYFRNSEYVPKVYNQINEIRNYPVFCKPKIGYGSIGARKINEKSELQEELFHNNIILENLPGKEYTVDCFSNLNNELLYAFPRLRKTVRNGVSYVNVEPEEEIIQTCYQIGLEINKLLDFKGLWFFQVKEDINGDLKLLEICTRLATTMAFARYKGVNLPLLTAFIHFDMPVKINVFHNNIELYRYTLTKPKFNFTYDNLYIDFDDTLIIDGKVCLDAISLIYQSKNNSVKIYLITKHQFDLYETLSNFHIPVTIFDEIIHIDKEESKYKYINKDNSVFIDNFYVERKEVFQKTNAYVFDVEGIKGLLKE